ncbi:hypothetical protein FZW96_04435 [Bacillus sp. BGMRC 2118]|nr:hypothetical protein FZW96_04435 [Bacillus sp. BGMRC 2118]
MDQKIRGKVTRMIYELDSLKRELQVLSIEIEKEIKRIGSSDYTISSQPVKSTYKRVSGE